MSSKITTDFFYWYFIAFGSWKVPTWMIEMKEETDKTHDLLDLLKLTTIYWKTVLEKIALITWYRHKCFSQKMHFHYSTMRFKRQQNIFRTNPSFKNWIAFDMNDEKSENILFNIWPLEINCIITIPISFKDTG